MTVQDSESPIRCDGSYCALRLRCKRFTTHAPGHSEFAESPVEPGGRECNFFLLDPENVNAPNASLGRPGETVRNKRKKKRKASEPAARRLTEKRYEKVSRYLKPEHPKLRLVTDDE